MRAVVALLLLLFSCRLGWGAIVRGVQPELAAKYEPNADKKWSCLDGSKTIDFDRVNDLYCDCPDGSDEPGTPACSNGLFYCRNRGHEAKVLSTAFVDDGVCDCCDGTDELEGCKNTCIERNAAVREGLKQKVEDYKRALAKRAEYAAGAAEERARMQSRLGAVDGDITTAEQEVERLAGEKANLQDSAESRKAARVEARREEAAKRKAEAAARKAEQDAKAAEIEAAAAAAGAGPDAADAGATEPGAEEGGEGAAGAGAEGGAEAAAEETVEERGRRIAAQWTNDPEAAGKAAAEAAAEGGSTAEAPKDGTDAESGAKVGWLSSTWSKLKDAVANVGAGGPDPPLPTKDDPDYDAPTCEEPTCYDSDAPPTGKAGEDDLGDVDTDDELDSATSAHSAAEERVASLRAEKERLTRQVTYDYGADDAWLALVSHCSSAREPQYTYRLCLFDKAAQVDNGAHHETSLGVWKGFEKGYSEGVFENGDWCHQAPARSMRVHFECGESESAWGASEPSTCAYTASMATPAACKAEDLKALEDRLADLVKEEEALAREIAEEEEARRAVFAARAAEAEAAADHSEL